MRILYVAFSCIDLDRGATEHIISVARGLAGMHEVHLIARLDKAGASPRHDLGGVVLHPVPRPSGDKAHMRSAFAFRRALRELLARERFDLAYVRAFQLDRWIATGQLSAAGLPYAYEMNTLTAEEFRCNGKPWRGRIYAWAESKSARASAAIIPITPQILHATAPGWTRPWMLARNGFHPAVRGFDPAERAAVRARLGVGADVPVVAMAGFTNRWQGIDLLAQAVADPRLDGAELWLIGSHGAEDEAMAQAAAREAGLPASRLRVLPWCDQRTLAGLLMAADIGGGPLALFRKDMHQGLTVKIRAYFGAGLPTVIGYTDVGVDPYPPWLLQVDARKPGAVADAIVSLRAAGFDRTRISAWALENLTWDAVVASTDRFLRGLVPAPV